MESVPESARLYMLFAQWPDRYGYNASLFTPSSAISLTSEDRFSRCYAVDRGMPKPYAELTVVKIFLEKKLGLFFFFNCCRSSAGNVNPSDCISASH